MNVYFIYQTKRSDFETYKGAVVVAKNSLDAVHIHPAGDDRKLDSNDDCTWVSDPVDVYFVNLGEALPNAKEGAVLYAYYFGGDYY